MEGPVEAWKADRRSRYCRESSLKVSRPHEKLTELDRRSSGRTKHFRKVPWMHEILTEVPRTYKELMEVDKMSRGRTES